MRTFKLLVLTTLLVATIAVLILPVFLTRNLTTYPAVSWNNDGNQLWVLYPKDDGWSVRVWDVIDGEIMEVDELPQFGDRSGYDRFAVTHNYLAVVVDGMIDIYALDDPDHYDTRMYIGTVYGHVEG